ncbi:DUF721 domain-containing protein [Parvularcula maris]|uniref:DUF721 domain-containing protein n=1 Tax=Parvularcula maris TaxID=2965077 RepID=A0A9X2L9J0_9PROT|nr:DUF721 domain-containing protein [Parvularcula maris]MCQ8185618.1 DUF721 domain-containing protein [Parvularcula maris]
MREPGPKTQGFRTRPARRAAPKLAQSLAPHLSRLAKASGAMDPRLAAEWAEIAGPELASLARPIRIVQQGRVQALELSVKSGAAATRLRYAQDALLGRIRQKLGLPRLSKITFREGADASRWNSRRMAAPKPDTQAPRGKEEPKSESLRSALDAMQKALVDK